MSRLPNGGELARSFAELLAVSGLAIAQPILDVFGRSPETFVFANLGSAEIVAFGLLVVLVPAELALLIEVAAGVVHPRARRPVHLGLLGLFTAAWLVQIVLAVVSWPTLLVAVIALAMTGGLVIAYRRSSGFRSAVIYAAFAPLVFLVSFLFVSPVSDLVTGGDVEAAADVRADVPVVLVVLDELPLSTLLDRRGQIDSDMYPNLAAFASESTWYRNATTTQGQTLKAVPAIFTGQDTGFDETGPTWTDHPDSLFTLLGGSYELNVAESLTQVCPPNLCDPAQRTSARPTADLLGDAWNVWVDRLEGQSGPIGQLDEFAEDVETGPVNPFGSGQPAPPERFSDFLDRFDGLPPASLSAIHLVLPHRPFVNLPSGHSYANPPDEATGFNFRWGVDSSWPPLLGRQRHVLQAQYVDLLLGQLMQRMREVGLYDEAVVVVTADHGANFAPGAVYRAGTQERYDQIMWVPTIIKGPHQRSGAIDDRNMTSVDIVPTIAALIGVSVPYDLDGISAVGPPRETGEKRYYRFHVPPFLPDPELLIEADTGQGSTLSRQEVYPSARQGEPAWWPYQVGDYASLIGTPVSGLTTGGPWPVNVSDTGDVEAFADVDLAAAELPVFVGGAVDAPASGSPPTPVLVAINGQVAGVSEVFRNLAGESRFAVMVPELLLRNGPNQLALFAVEGAGIADLTLRPISLA